MTHNAKPISLLRRRMIEDMTLRKLAPQTQSAYIRAVKNFAHFFGQSPDAASAEDLRRYQLHLVEQGISSGNLNATITGLKFFFETTLQRPEAMAKMSHVHEPRKIPLVLSLEEVTRLLESAGSLKYQAALAETNTFTEWLPPMRQCEWLVYAKRPFAGADAVLAYLSRYPHRVAIANSRLIAWDEQGVTFKWKDYRLKGRVRDKTMTLTADEFIRRFLLHVLPAGFHRIRHYGLIANTTRQRSLAQARERLMREQSDPTTEEKTTAANTLNSDDVSLTYVCPDCGAPMLIIDTFPRATNLYR